MKISKILSAKLVATLALICTLSACGTPADKIPNEIYFNVGQTVAFDNTYQFLSVTSDEVWTLAVEYLSPEDHTDWCTLSSTSGQGSSNIIVTYGKNPLEEDRSLKIVATFPKEKQELILTQRSQLSQLEEDKIVPAWLELPTFTADGDRYYFSKHMMPSKNNKERSFSLFYDSDVFIPLWVAYPLCKGNISGSGNRVDDWGIFDPNIPQEKQLYMRSSYAGSYDRGHMLPSASRLGSNDDNQQTFYPTNMTPQLSGLNQKKWSDIEKQVRNWVINSRDTLYVVTGAVLQTVGGNETVNYTYCKSDSNKNVAIPNYYYKALLQYRKSSGSYQAIAIWVPHVGATGPATMDDVITIDRLEELTGLDFFHNLADEVEDSVEQNVNPIYWGL